MPFFVDMYLWGTISYDKKESFQIKEWGDSPTRVLP